MKNIPLNDIEIWLPNRKSGETTGYARLQNEEDVIKLAGVIDGIEHAKESEMPEYVYDPKRRFNFTLYTH